jgi:hypothetical protein
MSLQSVADLETITTVRALKSFVGNFPIALKATPSLRDRVLTEIISMTAIGNELNATIQATVMLRADSLARRKWNKAIEVGPSHELG